MVQLVLFTLPPTWLSSLARGFGVPNHIVLGRLASDQDLLCSCANIVFYHRIFVRPPEQIIHSHGGLFGKGLEEWRARADAPLKDLEDNVHAIGFYLEYSLPKSF